MDTLSALFLIIATEILGFTVVFLVLKKKIEKISDSSFLTGKIREEVNQIIVELNQTADRNIALIEDRIQNIIDLLSKADKRISVLQRETEKHEVSKNMYQNVMEATKRKDEVNRQQEVLRLFREGISSVTIANRTGIPIGEVELIISLGSRKR